MRLNLIPAPQKVCITDETAFLMPVYETVCFYMPEEDLVLKQHAKELFGTVKTYDGYAGYLLYSEGRNPLSGDCPDVRQEKADAYTLSIDRDGFAIASASPAGLYYGLCTLKQLLSHQQIPSLLIEDWADTAMRSDYLDLRNIYPTFDRILYFIKELSCYKINTLVVEYEDKLPFPNLTFLRHPKDCFTQEEFARLLETAKHHYIEIIPLQQSFGHLEYVLKYPEYIHLRETKKSPGEMCPLRAGSLELSKSLLSEAASLHPESRYLHIGCDEVWSLGTSQECRESGKTRETIFIEFVNRLIDHVCALGKIPIIWHDMFAHAAKEELALLDKRVQVAIWLYMGSDMPVVAKAMMHKLDQEGISYLGCSAVRCWDRQVDQNYPVIDNRLLNLDLWREVAMEKSLVGLIHTNWASTFSFGRPYGLFETSRYPLIYAADMSWNLNTDKKDFLYRFLHLYHGMDTSELEERGYRNRDYYQLMNEQYEKAVENYETAFLIHCMAALESSFPVQHTLFRCELYPDSEVEFACLKERSETALQNLDKVQKELEAFIPTILNESMGRLFLESRFYPYHMAKKRLLELLSDNERKPV